MASGKSLDAFRREAAKCVLVCANCHGEIEAGVTPSPPAGAKFGEDWAARTTVQLEPVPETAPIPLQQTLDNLLDGPTAPAAPSSGRS